jgi:broad specificity phosphatase PhoE
LFVTGFEYTSVMETTRILAIRHGETDWNVATRIQGQIDISLNAQGQWQASQVAKALAEEDIHAVYASDLSRAWVTAQQIAAHHQHEVKQVIALRERHYGFLKARLGMRFKPPTQKMQRCGATAIHTGPQRGVAKAW